MGKQDQSWKIKGVYGGVADWFQNKIGKKCKKLLVQGLLENVKTKSGDIIVLYKNKTDGQNKKVIIYQEDYDQLLSLNGKTKDEKLGVSKLDSAILFL